MRKRVPSKRWWSKRIQQESQGSSEGGCWGQAEGQHCASAVPALSPSGASRPEEAFKHGLATGASPGAFHRGARLTEQWGPRGLPGQWEWEIRACGDYSRSDLSSVGKGQKEMPEKMTATVGGEVASGFSFSFLQFPDYLW